MVFGPAMDPLTHTLTGFLIARSGLGKWCPRGTMVAVVAANAPDVDFVSRLGGDLPVFEYHG